MAVAGYNVITPIATDKQRAFACYFCNRQFTRNDLLQVHLRRHESRTLDNTEPQRDPTPPHQGHRDALLRKTNPLWNGGLSPTTFHGRPTFAASNVTEQLDPISFEEESSFRNAKLPRQESITTLENAYVEAYEAPQIPNQSHRSLMEEFPELNHILKDKGAIQGYFEYGLAYLDVNMPFVHVPTLHILPISSLLLLSICCLGAILNPISDAKQTARIFEQRILLQIQSVILTEPEPSDDSLRVMVIIEYIGHYSSTSEQHRIANLIHEMVIQHVQRKRPLPQSYDAGECDEESLNGRWRTWAQHEALIRLVHCLFLNNTLHSIHFTYPNLPLASLLKLPLPCPPKLWNAKSPNEWKREISQIKPEEGTRHLQTSMRILLGDAQMSRNRIVRGDFEENPFYMYILIQGIASAVIELNQAMPSTSSNAVRLLKSADFKAALAQWWEHFNTMDDKMREEEMSISALISYHFTYILLYMDVNRIAMAARIPHARDNANPLELEGEAQANSGGGQVYLHLLEVLQLCLDEQHKPSLRPLHRGYTEFLTVIIYSVHLTELEYQKIQQPDRHRDRTREHLQPTTPLDLITMKIDVHRTMRTVRDRLVCNSWELGQEASQVLDSILGGTSLI
ncbi:hypothetical protein O988_02645 [Pseudogymnoascus sp. VKM F-3808]|nr:hypothetical protein O988_02645 [Pseudogymnoascus sp. VKM F-3808]